MIHYHVVNKTVVHLAETWLINKTKRQVRMQRAPGEQCDFPHWRCKDFGFLVLYMDRRLVLYMGLLMLYMEFLMLVWTSVCCILYMGPLM